MDPVVSTDVPLSILGRGGGELMEICVLLWENIQYVCQVFERPATCGPT